MDKRTDDLWQGGAWEQPAPSWDEIPRVHIPEPKGKKKHSPRRRWLIFSLMLALAVGAGALAFWLRGAPGFWHTLPFLPEHTRGEVSAEISIPRTAGDAGRQVELKALPEQSMSYADVYEKNENAIVAVHVLDDLGTSQGTGIVLSEDGYIITNAHVLEGARQAVVVLHNDEMFDAMLVGCNMAEDLAVLKIDAQQLQPAEFGDSMLMRVGDEVSALGNPLGYRMTLTPGIVSAVDRKMEVDGNTMYLLQTSAAINFGNSGGALFNDRGQVVGVTTMKIVSDDGSAEGLSFAIPSERVKYVVDHLLAGEQLRTPALGITVVQDARREGLAVEEIQSWSDAAGKLQVGDMILSVNGCQTVTNRQLQRIKDLQRVGDTLFLQVRRQGQVLEIPVLLVDNDRYEQGNSEVVN